MILYKIFQKLKEKNVKLIVDSNTFLVPSDVLLPLLKNAELCAAVVIKKRMRNYRFIRASPESLLAIFRDYRMSSGVNIAAFSLSFTSIKCTR